MRKLDLRPGQSVLDIGCGPGAVLQLREAVGAQGRVVGVDYSPRMLAKARTQVDAHGWTDVELREADASTDNLGRSEFDAAIALSSLSAMPDIRAAIEHARDALRPDGRLFVFDLRLIHSGRVWQRAMTKLLRLAYRALAGFTGDDVPAELQHTFATVVTVLPPERTKTMITCVVATKRDDSSGPDTTQGTSAKDLS
ncbi:MAG: class I SAM-dependent methyltransferase [Mycobacteriales bacterium]